MSATRHSRGSAILLGLMASAVIGLSPLPALGHAADLNGFVTPGDAVCWLNPACSLPRGGDSDVMTVYRPDGSILLQAFAFGNEEVNNLYYFTPDEVPINPAEFGNYSTVLGSPGDLLISDQFGIADVPGVGRVLGFISDPNTLFGPPFTGPTFGEGHTCGILNPVPEPGPDDSRCLTGPFDATRYLSLDWQQLGYRADFVSDNPEPATLALLGMGLAALAASRRRKSN